MSGASPAEGPAMPPGRLFVVGSGIMGGGIAAQAALKGWHVDLYDVDRTFLDRGVARLDSDLQRMVSRGKIHVDEMAAAKARVNPVLKFHPASRANVVMEAAPESLETKREVFRKIDAVAPDDALFGSNTSSLSITALASVVRDPGRLVGIHFFNPVLQMELVEVIAGYRTRPETAALARAFGRALGKTVTSSKDTPGFVTTRALAVLTNEAIWMLHDGVASREDIDTAHKLGFHHPMGPLELADLVGLDTLLSVLERLYTGFRDPKYRACPLLVSMVEAGHLGRKTGEGFYRYPPPSAPAAAGGPRP
jgi:3-hydroxybutyryl-CoA dehydrogenase